MCSKFVRPFDLDYGMDACILPWQRDEIREKCGSISCSVRQRASYGMTKKLSIVGEAGQDFNKAKRWAMYYIDLNFKNGVKAVCDATVSNKKPTPSHAVWYNMGRRQQQNETMELMAQILVCQNQYIMQPYADIGSEPMHVQPIMSMGYASAETRLLGNAGNK